MTLQPIHKHDCRHCILLGQARGKDVYLHPNEGGDFTLLLREGSAGPDYDAARLSILRRYPQDGAWLYALGLADGYLRAMQDELARAGAAVAAAMEAGQ